MVTCADALEEAVRHHNGKATSRQIFDYLNKHYLGQWKDGTIRAHIMGCTVNHTSSHHYKHFRKFLYHLGPGHVRLYDSVKDGVWKWTKEGMVKVEDGEISASEVIIEDEENGDTVDSSLISFTMERDLELFLYNDIEALEAGLEFPEDLETRQPRVESGRIDILAKDSKGYVVIELKAGQAKDQALTQLLAYMGDVGEQYESSTRGILVAHDFAPKLLRAAKLIPSVKLMKYNISFSFESM